ncbi:hypothetical protein C8J98_102504 [Luteibacter sp. OK325]|nr:hypothetical protein C8J98_102504 [Luteibacter sp. OK325]
MQNRGRRGAEPSVPTLAAQTVLRARFGRPLRGPCLMWPAAAHLCGTRLEGGHRRLSRALRFAWVEPKRARQHRRPACQHGREEGVGQPGASNRVRIAPGSDNGRGQRRHHATALLPPNRIVVRDLGVHPRGEFRTSGAAVGQIDTWAAKRPSAPNAEDCLSSEGGHQGLPRETPKCRGRRRRRAMREVRKNARPES